MVCGLSFAGKTTLAHALVRRLGYVEVDVDDTKVRLYGTDIRDETLSRSQWDHLYAEADAEIVSHIQNEQSVVDASRHFTRAERDHTRCIVRDLNCDVITIFVNIPESIVRQRWQENKRTQTRRDVSDQDFEAIVQAMQPPLSDEQPLVFTYGEEIEHWIDQHTSMLGKLSESP